MVLEDPSLGQQTAKLASPQCSLPALCSLPAATLARTALCQQTIEKQWSCLPEHIPSTSRGTMDPHTRLWLAQSLHCKQPLLISKTMQKSQASTRADHVYLGVLYVWFAGWLLLLLCWRVLASGNLLVDFFPRGLFILGLSSEVRLFTCTGGRWFRGALKASGHLSLQWAQPWEGTWHFFPSLLGTGSTVSQMQLLPCFSYQQVKHTIPYLILKSALCPS